MLTPFPCSSPHGEDRLCELLARYWRRQHPAFLYHPGGDLAKWGPHVMPPRQPFLGQGSKRGNAAAGRGRKGETGRAARAETGKQGISAGTTAPDRGTSITLPRLPSWGPPTPHVSGHIFAQFAFQKLRLGLVRVQVVPNIHKKKMIILQ